MKRVLRHFVIDTYSLWLTSRAAEGMVFDGGIKTLIFAGIAVTLVSVFAKPIINLLLLPINLISFGLFRWVASAVILYLVTLLIKDFKILHFNFLGYKSIWVDVPNLYFEGWLAFVAFSFFLSLLTSVIYWLLK